MHYGNSYTCNFTDIAAFEKRKSGERNIMDVSLILKIVGIGVLVSASASILNKSGKDEQAMLVTVAGIVVVMLMLVGEIGELFDTVRAVFDF